MPDPEVLDETIPGHSTTLYCPSAQPSLDRSMILGVVEQSEGGARVSFLERPVKVTEGTILAFVGNRVRATDVFRFAAPCDACECRNWSGSTCRVAERLVQIIPSGSNQLPRCKLRPICRWFQQEGEAACMRCTQVVTNSESLEAALNEGRTEGGRISTGQAAPSTEDQRADESTRDLEIGPSKAASI